MAENQGAAQTTKEPTLDPVLRQGRAADPVPAVARASSVAPVQGTTPEPSGQEGSSTAQQELPPPAAPAEASAPGPESPASDHSVSDPEQQAGFRQSRLRLLLRQCDRVLLMDFDLLAMNEWPDNYTLAAARRSRDLWLFSALIAAAVFLSGLTGAVPAWIAGAGFGSFIIILLLGIPALRRVFNSSPSYLDVIFQRQRMLQDARRHIAHLEGEDGLIWQCARMAEFNPSLRNTRFGRLLRLSEQRALAQHLTRREHVRLYLIYLLEAEKAYGRVQSAFFEGNQEALDQGWREVVAEPEPRT